MITQMRAIERVRSLIPDLEGRIGEFEVEAFDLDEEIMGVFRDELKRLSDDLQEGLDPLSREEVMAAAHSLKGMCGAMGLPEISVLAQEIERTLRVDDLERCSQLSIELIEWAHESIALEA